MTSRLRVAVVGARGHAARVALPTARCSPGTTLVSVVGTDRQRTSEVAQQFGIRPVHVDDPPEALDADAVWITAPNHLHPTLAERYLRAGLHVLLEKPLAIDVASASSLMTTVGSTDRILRVAYQHRFRPAHIALRGLLADNAFGPVGRLRIHRYWRFPYFPGQRLDDLSPWRRAEGTSGGWVINDVGSHLIDLVLWLFEDRTVEVTSAIFGSEFEGISTDSSCAMTCLVDGRIAVEVDCSNSLSSPGSRIELYGRDGWARLSRSFEDDATIETGTASSNETTAYSTTDAAVYAALFADFVTATSGGPSTSATAEQALRNVEVIEAARTTAGTTSPTMRATSR
jgi:predicted dehydrogenase